MVGGGRKSGRGGTFPTVSPGCMDSRLHAITSSGGHRPHSPVDPTDLASSTSTSTRTATLASSTRSPLMMSARVGSPRDRTAASTSFRAQQARSRYFFGAQSLNAIAIGTALAAQRPKHQDQAFRVCDLMHYGATGSRAQLSVEFLRLHLRQHPYLPAEPISHHCYS